MKNFMRTVIAVAVALFLMIKRCNSIPLTNADLDKLKYLTFEDARACGSTPVVSDSQYKKMNICQSGINPQNNQQANIHCKQMDASYTGDCRMIFVLLENSSGYIPPLHRLAAVCFTKSNAIAACVSYTNPFSQRQVLMWRVGRGRPGDQTDDMNPMTYCEPHVIRNLLQPSTSRR